jgi:hypothetical protein
LGFFRRRGARVPVNGINRRQFVWVQPQEPTRSQVGAIQLVRVVVEPSTALEAMAIILLMMLVF